MSEIILEQEEYTVYENGRIGIEVATILQKIPRGERKPYSSRLLQEAANRLHQQLIDAGGEASLLNHWLALNAQHTKWDSRNVGRLYRLIKSLDELQRLYGSEALNAALLKIASDDDHRKATLAYLKTVLQNVTAKDQSSNSNY